MDALRKKRKIDAASSVIHLPRDMITEVLRKLPVKTLIRFKSVSKTWYDLISDPKFHAMQRKIVESIGPSFSTYCQRLLIRNYSAGSDSLTIHGPNNLLPATALPLELLVKLKSLRPQFRPDFGYNYFRAIGPCNGVYLVDDFYYGNTAMWNHATREYKLLRLPEGYYISTGIFDWESRIHGFISEEFADGRVDFLVVIFYISKTNMNNILFRSSTGSWKTLKSQLPEECYYCQTVSKYMVHVNKKIYWLACRKRIHFLLCFDTISETFEKVDLPDCVQEYFPKLSCYTLNGKKSVSLILNENVVTGEMNVCVMNENNEGRSWVSIEGIRVPENIWGFRVLDESSIEKALKQIKYKWPELADGRVKLWMDGFQYEGSFVSLTWKSE
ncbi:hypothetical protein QQ045_028095 [Rhodiola kirilowii]